MFGGGKAKAELARIQRELEESRRELGERQEELRARERELAEQQGKLGGEAARLQEAERQRAEVDARCAELQAQREAQRAEIGELQEAQRRAQESEHASAGRLTEELATARAHFADAERSITGAREERAALEAQLRGSEAELAESREALRGNEAAAQELRRRCEQQSARIAAGEQDKMSRHVFLDIAVGECEFASAFAYSLALQLRSRGERRSTDVAQPPSQRPVFESGTFLLPSDPALHEDELLLSAYVHVADPTGAAVPRLLGEAALPLAELKIAEGAQASRRVVRTLPLLRRTGGDAGGGGGKELQVGRATVSLQAKVLSPTELAASVPGQVEAPSAPLPASFPSLDRSLWAARPFQHRLHALVHRAGALPPSAGAAATVRVALRLTRADGQVLHESATTDVPLPRGAEPGGEASRGSSSVAFGQELVLPIPAAQAQGQPLRAQLSLEMVSAEGGRVTCASLLDLQLRPESLPSLSPLHLLARPSTMASPVPSAVRPRPTLLVSLTREPSQEALGDFGADALASEMRLHGVPPGRPLPDAAEAPLLAVCVDEDGRLPVAPRVPVVPFFYDQRLELAAVVDAHFRGGGPKFFLTPAAAGSRTPVWGQFVLRFLASPHVLGSLTVLLYDGGGDRGDDADAEAAFGRTLLGMATVDASALVPGGADPVERSFQPDLRLLEAPGASASLELEVRIWPRPGAAALPPAAASAAASPRSPPAAEPVSARSVPPLPPAAATPAAGLAAAMQHEAQELRLNHELSVQLAKEFNMRAAALKRAGEEIVELRRQVQMLRGENARLQSQLDDEARIVEDARQRPIPEGLDGLSAAELAAKLQRALDRYREERAKGVELGRRLDEATREVARGRGLERSLEELERAHLEQNRQLQRMQDESRKLDTYRQTTKTQEKVIAKLEKILESSLQEVQRAQRVQVDVERIKTENARLREKCANLAARRGRDGGDAGTIEDLRSQLAQKKDEVQRLQALARDLQRGAAQRSDAAAAASPDLARERQRLEEAEARRLDWEQRCDAAERRQQHLQQQITDSSRKYGAEISSLQVEVAKRDARILELEYLVREGAGGASVAHAL